MQRVQSRLRAKGSATAGRKGSPPLPSTRGRKAAGGGPCGCPNPRAHGTPSRSPRGSGPRAPSDLREGEPVGAGGLLDLQLEGVLVGVVLHDVVVHVHQDPAGREATRVHPPPPALQSEPDRPASPPPTRCAAGGNLFQPLHASSSPSERQVQ